MQWISKIGATGKPLLLGLANNGTLIDFDTMTDPTLHLRSKVDLTGQVLDFPVTEYEDPNGVFNAQCLFTFDDIVAGEYIAEVDATIDGLLVTFPDDSYIHIKFLEGIE